MGRGPAAAEGFLFDESGKICVVARDLLTTSVFEIKAGD